MPASQLDPVLESNRYTVGDLPKQVGAKDSGIPRPGPAALRSDIVPSPMQCLLLSRGRVRSESYEARGTRGPTFEEPTLSHVKFRQERQQNAGEFPAP